MHIRITNIAWDTDGAKVDLPTSVTIDAAAEKIDNPMLEAADWLSRHFGWCVSSYSVEPVSETPRPRMGLLPPVVTAVDPVD